MVATVGSAPDLCFRLILLFSDVSVIAKHDVLGKRGCGTVCIQKRCKCAVSKISKALLTVNHILEADRV